MQPRRKRGRAAAHLIVLAVACTLTTPAQAGLEGRERKAFLDAIRPQAAQQAGQAVKFKVDRLNVAGDWALLIGELVAPTGGPLDWRKAPGCEPELDKMLWVVARRAAPGWQVEQMWVCAPEPPYWSLTPEVDHARPCALYRGLWITDERSVEADCLAHPSPATSPPPSQPPSTGRQP